MATYSADISDRWETGKVISIEADSAREALAKAEEEAQKLGFVTWALRDDEGKTVWTPWTYINPA